MTTKKVQEIIDLLDEGKSVKDIVAETGSSQPYVYTIKREHAKKETKNEDDNDYEMRDDEEKEYNDFIRKIKIKPDPKVLTGNNDGKKDENESDTEEYQCGGCGATFSGDRNTFQMRCPVCGIELA